VKVPFTPLAAHTAAHRDAIDTAISRVIESGWYIGGPEVESFERDYARYIHAADCVGVANGTDAVALALRALGVGPGDEVILPALSAYPTAAAVAQIGATPAFVDVSLDDGLTEASLVERAIGPRTRAIVPVHLYGAMCDLPALEALCRARSLALVEDCAQAHGASRGGVRAGSRNSAAWSFYPTKNLGALGDAGAVTCNDDAIAARLRRLRNYGQRNRYEHVEPGVNSRLDPLQAAVLRAKLPSLKSENERRRAIAARYDESFVDSALISPLQIPRDCIPSRHLYPVRVRDPAKREAFMAALAKKGIETLIHYPIAMPDQGATPLEARRGEWPAARALCNSLVSLPIHPLHSDEQIAHVIDAVRDSST
jgi:dTDP-4-amino-4,6-dideoxygalactose transaminase